MKSKIIIELSGLDVDEVSVLAEVMQKQLARDFVAESGRLIHRVWVQVQLPDFTVLDAIEEDDRINERLAP